MRMHLSVGSSELISPDLCYFNLKLQRFKNFRQVLWNYSFHYYILLHCFSLFVGILVHILGVLCLLYLLPSLESFSSFLVSSCSIKVYFHYLFLLKHSVVYGDSCSFHLRLHFDKVKLCWVSGARDPNRGQGQVYGSRVKSMGLLS